MSELNGNARQTDFKIELLVIFAILISLGFPGNFTEIYGEWMGSVMEYAAFVIEILAMLLSSGKSWLDVRLVNLDKKYTVLYLFGVVIFIESMMVTRYPSLQFITCIRLFVTLLFAIWLQEQFRFERVIELICIAQTIFVLFVLVFMLMYPGRAFESGATFIRALKGLYPSKNSFASELAFGIAAMAFFIRERRKQLQPYRLWMIILLIQGILMAMCQATGPVFCMVIALAALFLPSHVRLQLGWGYIAGNVLFLFATLTFMPYFEWFFNAIGKDATLTGRIPLWNQIISVMMNHNTFTGYGYGMFWRDSRAVALIHAGFSEYSFLGTMTTGAHNVLLEFWLNSGLIGIAMFFAALLYTMRDIEEIPPNNYLFSSMILVYLMMNGLTERCLGGNYDYKMLGMFLVMALCCNRPGPESRPLRQKAEDSQAESQ